MRYNYGCIEKKCLVHSISGAYANTLHVQVIAQGKYQGSRARSYAARLNRLIAALI